MKQKCNTAILHIELPVGAIVHADSASFPTSDVLWQIDRALFAQPNSFFHNSPRVSALADTVLRACQILRSRNMDGWYYTELPILVVCAVIDPMCGWVYAPVYFIAGSFLCSLGDDAQ